jgi:acyl-CoA synthetase (AMP-forming)/AMP-acid ligase II
VLLLSPGVSEVAVVGLPDERLGEVPVAFVVGDASDAELGQLCRDHLVAYKIPVAFRRMDTLPRSEVGKVLGRELVLMGVAGESEDSIDTATQRG